MAHVTSFLLDLIESKRLTSAQSVQSYLSAIDSERALRGVRAFQADHDRLWQLFKDAVGKALPKKAPIDAGSLPASSNLVQFLPSDRLLRDRVKRTALLIRMVTMLRSKDVVRIKRDTMQRVRFNNGVEVVRFHFESKMSVRLNLEHDVNYVEFIEDTHAALCPARALLALAEEVERLMQGVDEQHRHNGVFVDIRRPYRQLSQDTIGRYSTDLLKKWIDHSCAEVKLTGHKLRLIAADTLRNRGVSHTSLCIRGGWKPDGNAPWSSVLQQVYSSRVVPENFARVALVTPAAAAGTVSEQRL